MQFSGPSRSISNACSASLCRSTNITGVALQALLLPSKDYLILVRVPYLCRGGRLTSMFLP